MQDQSKVYEHNSTKCYREKHVNEKGFSVCSSERIAS